MVTFVKELFTPWFVFQIYSVIVWFCEEYYVINLNLFFFNFKTNFKL